MIRTFLVRLRLAPWFLATICAAPPLAAADWPGYLGANRDGHSSEVGLFTTWPAEGPEVLWRQKIGQGYSSSAIARDRVFTQFATGSHEYLVAYDTKTGEELWRSAIGSNRFDGYGGGPRATPTTDGDVVCGLGALADLTCADAATGEIRWHHNLRKQMRASVPTWGVASSPLIEGDLLIVLAGGTKKRTFAAFDKLTGEVVWTSGKDLPAYASPIVTTIGDVRQAVFFGVTGLTGVAVDDGRVLWQAPWVTKLDVNAATPIFVPENGILVTSGYDTGSALLQVVAEKDRFKVYQIWRNKVMRPHFNSLVRVDGAVYGFDDDVAFKCVDVLTGKEKWRGRAGSKGSLIHADGLLIVLGGQGRLSLVKADPEAFDLIADAQVLRDKTWAAPSLSDGVIYIRGFTKLAAVRIGPPTMRDAEPVRESASP